MLTTPSDELILQTIDILATANISDSEIETRVAALSPDAMTARRLVDWIPEAFGLVLVFHWPDGPTPSKTFSARDKDGNWHNFECNREPIFGPALRIGAELHHQGHPAFGAIALRSSTGSALNKALIAGAPLKGGTISGPAFIGIPAEIYSNAPKTPRPDHPETLVAETASPAASATRPSIWRRLFGQG